VIRLFNADGTVKQEWAGALHTSPVTRQGKLLTQICGSNSVLAEIELTEGEQVGAQFTPPGEAAEAVPENTQAAAPEPTQAPAVNAEPHAPLTVQEVAQRLSNAGMPAQEAEALATLHNDVDKVLEGIAESVGAPGVIAPQTPTVEPPQQ
jgi:hypothetical protein